MASSMMGGAPASVGESTHSATSAANGQNRNLRDPVDKAVRNTNSRTYSTAVSEAIGELGMEEYKQRSGIQDDPRFIKRYHGSDDIGKMPDSKKVGLEAKGTSSGDMRLSKHSGGRKQLSKNANLKRAQKMLHKQRQGKVDKPSNRIGGPYTNQEMELYKEIALDGGKKKLISTHTNTETGEVTVVERDSKGDPTKKEKFQIDNFVTKKQKILNLLKH